MIKILKENVKTMFSPIYKKIFYIKSNKNHWNLLSLCDSQNKIILNFNNKKTPTSIEMDYDEFNDLCTLLNNSNQSIIYYNLKNKFK